ncbi:unnamed protein product [Scytosiphon promiscuus]
MNGLRETPPPGPYFPFHRDETYPRTLCVNFKRLEFRTLQKYCKLHNINVRPDCTQSELAVAAARHFQAAPSVDEEGVMVSFLQRVIVPDRPFQCTIDLALARRGSPADDRSDDLDAEAAGAELDETPDAMGHAHDRHHPHHPSNGGFMDDGHPPGLMGGGELLGEGRDGVRGGVHGSNNGGHGYGGGRHGHPSAMGYDEAPRAEAYPSRGMGPGYEHESDYGRPPPQMSSMSPWEQDGGHGGEMMPKLAKRSGGGGSGGGGGGRGRNGRGSCASAPAHGSLPVMAERGMPVSGGGGLGGDDHKGRKQKTDRTGGVGGGGGGGGGGVIGDTAAKAPPVKKRKGAPGWRAKNGEQVAVRDDREEPGSWILARVMKYVPETHQYELKDDDDKEGIGMLTAPRSLVIRLEDSTKGVQKGERVLAVFPDTTSFYLGTVHRVPKPAPGAERRIDVKFNDDADDTGRTPARPLPARYVVPLPEGFEEDDSKPAEDDDDEPPPPPPPAAGGGGAGGGAGEEDADDPMGEKNRRAEEDGEPPYAEMIRTALLKLPGRQGNLPTVCAYIEEHFHDRLNWRSESSLRRTPAWKASVRRTLAHHPSFCHAGTPERNVYTLVQGD